MQVSALDFQRNIGEMQDRAQVEPIEITRHGRKHVVLIGAALFEALVSRARQGYTAEDVPDDIARAITGAEMDPRHAALNKLLEK